METTDNTTDADVCFLIIFYIVDSTEDIKTWMEHMWLCNKQKSVKEEILFFFLILFSSCVLL